MNFLDVILLLICAFCVLPLLIARFFGDCTDLDGRDGE